MVQLPQPRFDVVERVKKILVNVLDVDIDEVTLDAKLFKDLGMESLDPLDVFLRLEKDFSIEIPRSAFWPEDILTNADFVQDGRVTEAGMEVLRKRMSFADLSAFAASRLVGEFGSYLTVGDLCRYIQIRCSQ